MLKNSWSLITASGQINLDAKRRMTKACQAFKTLKMEIFIVYGEYQEKNLPGLCTVCSVVWFWILDTFEEAH